MMYTSILEAVLNSRRLTPSSLDQHDLECLTPEHILVGQPLLAVPSRSPAIPNRCIISWWKLLDHSFMAPMFYRVPTY